MNLLGTEMILVTRRTYCCGQVSFLRWVKSFAMPRMRPLGWLLIVFPIACTPAIIIGAGTQDSRVQVPGTLLDALLRPLLCLCFGHHVAQLRDSCSSYDNCLLREPADRDTETHLIPTQALNSRRTSRSPPLR